MISFNDLPLEIKEYIFFIVSPSWLYCQCKFVCKEWHKILVSPSFRNRILNSHKRWDLYQINKLKEKRLFSNMTITCMESSPNYKLYLGGLNNIISVWSMKDNKKINNIEVGGNIFISTLKIDKNNDLYSGDLDGTIKKWSGKNEELISIIKVSEGNLNTIKCIRFDIFNNIYFSSINGTISSSEGVLVNNYATVNNFAISKSNKLYYSNYSLCDCFATVKDLQKRTPDYLISGKRNKISFIDAKGDFIFLCTTGSVIYLFHDITREFCQSVKCYHEEIIELKWDSKFNFYALFANGLVSAWDSNCDKIFNFSRGALNINSIGIHPDDKLISSSYYWASIW